MKIENKMKMNYSKKKKSINDFEGSLMLIFLFVSNEGRIDLDVN